MSQVDILDRLINDDPTVRNKLAPGVERVHMAAFFARPGNFMLGDATGAALFATVSPGVYEGHYLFPSGAIDKIGRCRRFIDQVFTDHYADAIVGHTPEEDSAARVMSRALGFTRRGTSVSASGRSCVDYVLERREWATLSAALSAASAPSSEQASKRTPQRKRAKTR